MYSVSSAYMAALRKPVHRYKLRGTIQGVAFTEADVLQSSLSVTNKCSKDGEVEIGGIYAAEMHITFVNDLGISRYSWVGSRVTIEEGLNVGAGAYEYIPIGVYYVSEANYTSGGIVVTAYDKSSNLDGQITLTSISGTLYQMVSAICTECDVTLANSDFDNFPNSTVLFDLPEQNELNTYRDLLSAIAQAMCAFATINRDDELEFRMYGSSEVDEIDPQHRFEGGSFSDYVTRYNAISYTNADGTTRVYTVSGMPSGLMYDAGKNPLMFDSDVARNAVLTQLSQIAFVPFSVGLAGTPAYDLGDCLRFTDGLADGTQLSCIMQFDYTYNASYMAEGFGKNPALQNLKTSEERQLQSVAQSTTGKGVVFYSFMNTSDLLFEDGAQRQTLLTISFITTDTTFAMLEGQAVLQIPEPEVGEDEPRSVAKLTYWLDGDEIVTIHPTWTWSESGKHTITFMYPTVAAQALIHRFEVTLDMVGSDATVATGECRAVVWGQNMAAVSMWDGTIECRDNVTDIEIGGQAIELDRISDSAGLLFVEILPISIGVEPLEPVDYIDVGSGVELAGIEDTYVFGKDLRLLRWSAVKTMAWSELKVDYHW